MSVSLFYFYFFDFIPSNNVIMLIPRFSLSWDFYGIRITSDLSWNDKYTHTHRVKLSLYLFHSIPFHSIHSSFRFLSFDFFRFVAIVGVACFVVTWFNFVSLSIRFTKILDWDIRMRIVSIPFDLIFACFQNKVLSCLIRRQSFVLLVSTAICQPTSHRTQASSLHK